jgi:hypothetical protein
MATKKAAPFSGRLCVSCTGRQSEWELLDLPDFDFGDFSVELTAVVSLLADSFLPLASDFTPSDLVLSDFPFSLLPFSELLLVAALRDARLSVT